MSSEEADDGVLPKEGADDLHTRRDNYKVLKLLGKGGYGAVYEVVRKSDGAHLAIKCEKLSAKKKVLIMDCCVLRGAQQIKSRHFCTLQDRGKVEGRFAFLVMQLIGKNLWDLRVDRDSMRFTIGTSLKAALQSLISIEEIHRLGFIHRDIKPGNFAVGREQRDAQTVYMLDFGLSRQYLKTETKKDVRKQRENAPFRGTTRYAPMAAMDYLDQSRKDDIEGWLYMVVEWTSGALPWRRFTADNRDEVRKMKQDLRSNEKALDQFLTGCPKREFARILKYLDTLTYFSIPDYKFVVDCIGHAMKTNAVKWTDPVDWDEGHEYTVPQEVPGDGRPIVLPEPTHEDEEKAPEKMAEKTKKSSPKKPKKD